MTSQAPEKMTYSIPEFARMLGVSRGFAYQQAAQAGSIAGVPIIKIGGSRMVIPKVLADRVLRGETVEAWS